jgi:hypothetical protein
LIVFTSQRRRYHLFFAAALTLTSLLFIYLRPWNSPWQPFIAGDGLGYYSHLPAIFIHHDTELKYQWFNEVHNRNYAYSAFENPEDNLLVQYGDRKINKYYPGLSFTWMPFFFTGHLWAECSDYSPDGYSLPYQISMGVASLFWLIVGLIYLRKLVYAITNHEIISLLVPLLIFAGTNLYQYAFFNNTLSHAYSFTFNTVFLYYAWSYFNKPNDRTRYFWLSALMLAITVSARPLNGLLLPLTLVFMPQGFISSRKYFTRFKFADIVPIVMLIALVAWHFTVTWKQTHSLFAYTYTNEKFDFGNSKMFDSLFSYHNGLFVYVPLALLAFVGAIYLKGKLSWVLPLYFLVIVFLYSSWWFWPITRRALIDFYPLLGIMLAGLLVGLQNSKLKYAAGVLVIFSLFHYQLKNYQVYHGILSEFSTYGELYWRNYFRTDPANIYPIPPATVLAREENTESFDGYTGPCKWTDSIAVSQQRALMLDQQWSSCIVSRCKYPQLFEQKGWRKVRVSFQALVEDSVNIVNMYLEFRKQDSVILNVPFYLVKDFINPGKWDYKEFGFEITDTTLINGTTVDEVTFAIWNPASKGRVFADDVKMEFLLTDRSFETIR